MRAPLWQAPSPVATIPAHEGPVFCAEENTLYFTTVPTRAGDGTPLVSILRMQLDDGLQLIRTDLVVHNANAANGMCASIDGGLLVCEQGTRHSRARISRLDRRTRRRETVADTADDLPLNSPNDVIQADDGTIWFTDPSYGSLQGFRPPPALPDGGRRVDSTGRTTTVSNRFDKPNGIAIRTTGDVLIVGDSGTGHDLWQLPVTVDGALGPGHRLAVVEPGAPDGLKVGPDGRLYNSCATGIQVRDEHGALLELIPLPGAVNFCFGGPDGTVLFVTDDTGIWLVHPTHERT